MKIKLEMDYEHALYLQKACEVIARIGMGQFADMVRFLKPDCNYDLCDDIACHLKFHLDKFDQPEESRVAWDVYQHIRRELSWYNNGIDWRTDKRKWPEMLGVSYDEPMKISKLIGDFKTERSVEK